MNTTQNHSDVSSSEQEVDTLLYLGAPSNDRLLASWKDDYRDSDPPIEIRPVDGTTWRRLSLQASQNTNSSQLTMDEHALDTSFSLYVGREGDDFVASDPKHEASLESIPATQFPTFDFDMSTVLEVEDVFQMPMVDKSGKVMFYSMLAVILKVSEMRQVVTRAGVQTQVLVLTLGDASANGFELAVWGSHAAYIGGHLRRLDVVLIHDFVLSTFNGVLGGTSRQGRSRFTLLYRTDRRGRADDQYRPLLQADLQSARVRAVRDWAVAWVPSETQPDDSQQARRDGSTG